MNFYFILLILVFVVTIILYYKFDITFIKKNIKYLLLIWGILVLFLIVRDPSVGVDTKNYQEIFEYTHEKGFIELLSIGRHELGFKYYSKIISMIYNNYSFFLMITSVLSMLGVLFFIKDNSKNYFSSLLIFITFNFFGYYFGILRQVLAISVLLISIKYIKERNLWKFVFCVLLASLFHKTSLVFLPLYFIAYIKIDKTKFIVWISAIFIFLIFKQWILDFIINYIFEPSSFNVKIGEGYKMLIFLSGLSVLCYFIQDKLVEQDKNNQLFINMVFLATIIQTIATVFSVAYRVTFYYAFAIIILIPNIIELIKNRKFKIGINVLMYILLTLYYLHMTSDLTEYVIYRFIF